MTAMSFMLLCVSGNRNVAFSFYRKIDALCTAIDRQPAIAHVPKEPGSAPTISPDKHATHVTGKPTCPFMLLHCLSQDQIPDL